MTENSETALLKDKLNLETAQIGWHELQRDFAAGRVISVAADVDLIEVAEAFAKDASARVQGWIEQDKIHPVTDAEALAWHEAKVSVWAVVVRPWVLVQHRTNIKGSH